MLSWFKHRIDAARDVAETQARVAARVAERERLDQEQKREMAHQERTILASLGFDLGNGEQNWLRQAQLMREHHDRLGALEAKVSEIDQLLMLSATHR
jgi:hypothetical protein